MITVTLITHVGGFDEPSGFMQKGAAFLMVPAVMSEVEIPSLDLPAPLRVERVVHRLGANDVAVYLAQIRAVNVAGMVEKMRSLGWKDV